MVWDILETLLGTLIVMVIGMVMLLKALLMASIFVLGLAIVGVIALTPFILVGGLLWVVFS